MLLIKQYTPNSTAIVKKTMAPVCFFMMLTQFSLFSVLIVLLFSLFELSDDKPGRAENKEEAIQSYPPSLQTIIDAFYDQKEC